MAPISKNIGAGLLGLSVFAIQGFIFRYGFSSPSLSVQILFGVLSFVCVSTGLLLFYLASFTLPSTSPLSEDLARLVAVKIFQWMAKRRYKELESRCRTFQQAQDAFLMDLLEQNKNTDYGRKYEFESIGSPAEYRSRHPVAKYAHFAPFVERLARGEENVLLRERPIMMALTSGTTGASKMFPRTASRRKNFFRNVFIMSKVMSWNALQKLCSLYTHFPDKFTEGGIRMGPSSMLLNLNEKVVLNYPTPLAGFKLLDERHSVYVHALFALRDRNLGGMVGNFISLVLKVFVTMEAKWELLVRDLRYGTLDPELDIPADIRNELEKDLRPLPERSVEVEAEFRKGFQGIARRIWPRLEVIFGVTGGSMEIYQQRLRKKYTEDVLVYSAFLICTEGFLGINLFPKLKSKPTYVLCPDALFFEFIPVTESSEEEEEPKAALLAGSLEVGGSYQILLTNPEGLYRYTLDDVYKVVDFWYEAPVVEFLYRIGEMFNISGKRFPEPVMRASISSAVGSLEPRTDLVDYACCEGLLYQEAKGLDGGDAFDFVAFVEMTEIVDGSTQKELETKINASLVALTIPEGFPNRNIGGKVRLVVVRPSAFDSFLRLILSTSDAGPSQVKVPRKLRKVEWVKFLVKFEA